MALELYKQRIPIIEDDRDLNAGFLGEPGIIRSGFGAGLVERDFTEYPVHTFGAAPSVIQQVSESEYDARWEETEERQSSLEHLFLPHGIDGPPAFVNLNQASFPDCWTHSVLHAAMMVLLAAGKAVPRFNGVAVATMMNRLNGGWCGASADFIRKHGIPVIGTGSGEWPELTRRNHDTPALRANMLNYKLSEDWYDTASQIWDQKLSEQSLFTCSFTNTPCAADWNFMSHSVKFLRKVRLERNSWGSLILNSWKGWGWHGLGVIRGRYANPNNAVGLLSLAA